MTSRCSPSRFFNIVKNFNENQKEAVKSIGFGSLLKLNDIRLRRTLINWLIDRYCPQTRTFHFGRHELELTRMDVLLILGLRVIGTPVVPKRLNHPTDHLMSYYKARCGQIDVKCLEMLLQTADSSDDFKRTFVLYALCTLLAPKPRPEVSASFLQCILDTEKISLYAWGDFALENLLSELDTYKREGHKYIGGCVVLLQFWYYEHFRIPVEGLNGEPKKFPRISEWDGSRCLERDKKEGHLGGYGHGEIIVHISPTPTEAVNDEVKRLLAMGLPISVCKISEANDVNEIDSHPRANEVSDSHDMNEINPARGETKQNEEKNLMIVACNTVPDGHASKQTRFDLPETMLGTHIVSRASKKRKMSVEILEKITALENLIEEQRKTNEELTGRLTTMERALSLHSDSDKALKLIDDRVIALEHALEQQISINEELKRRMAEVEKSNPPNCPDHSNVCTENHK